MREDFVIFILSHNRADEIKTHKAVRTAGYTGRVIIVLDNEDKSIEQYKEQFGDDVYVFDKLAVSKQVDSMDLGTDRRAVLYARCACFDIAKELGYKYFLELDDDYVNFRSRVLIDDVLRTAYIRDFDKLVDIMIEFLDTSKAHTVALSQIGDFIGGKGSKMFNDRLSRKAMNAFFCTTDRPFKWFGRMNEDVSAYIVLGSRGYLFFTIADVSVDHLATQSLSGGMSESYLNAGTYVKTFYTVMCAPSSVKIYTVGVVHKRFHHLIDWNASVPKIISGKYKKQ